LLLGAVVPVGWALLPTRGRPVGGEAERRGWQALAAAVAAAGAVSFLVAVPWGLGNVWDQAFRYHLEAAGPRTPIRNLRELVSTLGDRDLPLVLAAAASALMAATGSRRRSTAAAETAVGTGKGASRW